MRLRGPIITAMGTFLALMPGLLLAEGGTGASFLSLDAGAEAAAVGGAIASRPPSAAAVFWNPGALGWLKGAEFSASHVEIGLSARSQHLAAAYGGRRLSLALSLQSFTIGGLEERTEPSASPISTFGATGLAPAVTCARRWGRNISAGTSLRLVYQKIGPDQATAVAGDLGVGFDGWLPGFRAGAALTNMGGGVRFVDQSYPLPSRLRLGAGYDLMGGLLSVSGDMVKPRHRPLVACLGAEGFLMGRLSIRAGYKGGLSDAGGLAGLSGGLGARVGGYGVDYAAFSRGVLGLAHQFSLSYRPGVAAGARAERAISAELQRRARVTAESFHRQGLSQMRSGQPDQALASFDLALVWDPDYSEAAQSLGEARAIIEDREAGRHLASGLAAYSEGRLIDAIADFGRVLEIRPEHLGAREWLQKASDGLVATSPITGAAADSTARTIDRHLRTGTVLLAAKKYSRAVEEWGKVLVIDPEHATARSSISRAKALQQQAVEAALSRAEQLGRQGRWPAALAQVNRAMALDPGSDAAAARLREMAPSLKAYADTVADRGAGLFRKGMYGQAEAELRLALSLDRDNRTAAEYLSRVASQRSKAAASEIADLYLKGISAYTQEDYAQAVEYWQRVVELDPGHANARRNLERAREKLKIIGQ